MSSTPSPCRGERSGGCPKKAIEHLTANFRASPSRAININVPLTRFAHSTLKSQSTTSHENAHKITTPHHLTASHRTHHQDDPPTTRPAHSGITLTLHPMPPPVINLFTSIQKTNSATHTLRPGRAHLPHPHRALPLPTRLQNPFLGRSLPPLLNPTTRRGD